MSFDAAINTILSIGDGADPATAIFTAVAQVTNIGDLALDTVFSEYYQYGAGAVFKERVPTVQMIGDLELELGYDGTEATHDLVSGGLVHAYTDKTKLAWKIVYSDAGALDARFVAYVKKIVFGSGAESHVVKKVTLSPSGAPTLA